LLPPIGDAVVVEAVERTLLQRAKAEAELKN
jgi:hypothetical protein